MADDWRERFRGVAEAQTRYLYLLGLAGLFFFALHISLPENPTTGVLGIPVSGRVVWATGPTVLGFLLAACGGTIAAMGRANARMDLEQGEFEREDIKPNALDMVAYTSVEDSRWALALGGLTYAVYLTLFLFEGGWLWWRLLGTDEREPVLQFALALGGAMLLFGAARVRGFVWGRLVRFWETVREKEASPTLREAMEILAEAESMLRGSGQKAETHHRLGQWHFLVDGSPVAGGTSVVDLAVSVRDWFRAGQP